MDGASDSASNAASGTTWSLRPATPDDVTKLLVIEKKVHVAPWNEEAFKAELTKPYSQLLLMTDDETDQEIAGYVVFWAMFDECQILNLAVDLPFRGLGFAKQMIRRVVTLASQKNAKRVLLEVRKSNQPAIQLYQAMGFTITHVRKKFYSDGEDAYEMVIEMNAAMQQF